MPTTLYTSAEVDEVVRVARIYLSKENKDHKESQSQDELLVKFGSMFLPINILPMSDECKEVYKEIYGEAIQDPRTQLWSSSYGRLPDLESIFTYDNLFGKKAEEHVIDICGSLFSYLKGQFPENEVPDLERHVIGCAPCRLELVQLRKDLIVLDEITRPLPHLREKGTITESIRKEIIDLERWFSGLEKYLLVEGYEAHFVSSFR